MGLDGNCSSLIFAADMFRSGNVKLARTPFLNMDVALYTVNGFGMNDLAHFWQRSTCFVDEFRLPLAIDSLWMKVGSKG